MLKVRWSSRTKADFERIAAYWVENDPDQLRPVLTAIYERIHWLADEHYLLGASVPGLPSTYRCYRERRYGYKIYYRLESKPTVTMSILTIRHGREHPLRPSTLRRFT